MTHTPSPSARGPRAADPKDSLLRRDEQGSYEIRLCRGVLGTCRFACPQPASLVRFVDDLAARIEASGWSERLAAANGDRPIHAHQRLRLAVAGCANGCSRPHIADLGFIASRRPVVDPSRCTWCEACAAICPDGAIGSASGVARIDPEACLSCGRCIESCPVDALGEAEAGLRVLAGGRLGRRPRLALELPGLAAAEQALLTLDRALELVRDLPQGQRIADVLAERSGELADELGEHS